MNVIQQAINVLERYAPQHGNPDDMESALASLRAAQEGDLPPLPEPAIDQGSRLDAYDSMHNGPHFTADQMREYARLALAAAGGGVPPGYELVPIEFLRGFLALAHNYSLRAEPPDFYRGVEGDAFSNAYRRCGEDLAKLRAMLASSPQPEAAPAVAQVPRTLTPEEDLLVGRMREALKTAKVGEFAKVDPELMRAIDDAALAAATPALLEIRKRERRLSWLHSPESHNVGGYEWGIYRVKWENGRAVEVLQTYSDFSDLDAAIAAAPEAPAQAAPSAGEVENKARTMHELSTVERDEAIRAFEAAHGDRFAAGFANDRAWVEGYAHARAALSHKEQP